MREAALRIPAIVQAYVLKVPVVLLSVTATVWKLHWHFKFSFQHYFFFFFKSYTLTLCKSYSISN